MTAPLYLAAFKGPAIGWQRKVAHRAVTLATGSPWSHVEVVIDGIGYSARVEGGVGPMFLQTEFYDFFPLADRFQTQEVRQGALDFFAKHRSEPYDWRGIWHFAPPLSWLPTSGRICTTVIANALGYAERDSRELDPGELVLAVTTADPLLPAAPT